MDPNTDYPMEDNDVHMEDHTDCALFNLPMDYEDEGQPNEDYQNTIDDLEDLFSERGAVEPSDGQDPQSRRDSEGEDDPSDSDSKGKGSDDKTEDHSLDSDGEEKHLNQNVVVLGSNRSDGDQNGGGEDDDDPSDSDGEDKGSDQDVRVPGSERSDVDADGGEEDTVEEDGEEETEAPVVNRPFKQRRIVYDAESDDESLAGQDGPLGSGSAANVIDVDLYVSAWEPTVKPFVCIFIPFLFLESDFVDCRMSQWLMVFWKSLLAVRLQY